LKPSFNKNIKEKNYKKVEKRNDKRQKKETKECSGNKATNPIAESTSGQIISGYFLNEKSYKELFIARVNNFLYIVLACLILFCLVCYYFVSCNEVKLNQISRATLELNFENDELQNKVDSLQSYYNIDKAVSSANILERAQKVVEVNAINIPKVNFNNPQDKQKHSFVVGY